VPVPALVTVLLGSKRLCARRVLFSPSFMRLQYSYLVSLGSWFERVQAECSSHAKAVEMHCSHGHGHSCGAPAARSLRDEKWPEAPSSKLQAPSSKL